MDFEESYVDFSKRHHGGRPSSVIPMGNRPSPAEADTAIRAVRVAKMQKRWANNQNIWTGEPLPLPADQLT